MAHNPVHHNGGGSRGPREGIPLRTGRVARAARAPGRAGLAGVYYYRRREANLLLCAATLAQIVIFSSAIRC